MTEAPRKTAPRWRVWAERALIVSALCFIVYRLVPDPRLPDLGMAPDARYPTLDGTVVGPDDFVGQVVVLNVWATWCPPCVVETPGFVGLADEFDGDVQFLGVSADDDMAAVRAFVSDRGVPYPILVGAPVSGTATHAPVLPTTLVIDRRGRVRMRHEGILLAPVLRPALRALVDEALVEGMRDGTRGMENARHEAGSSSCPLPHALDGPRPTSTFRSYHGAGQRTLVWQGHSC